LRLLFLAALVLSIPVRAGSPPDPFALLEAMARATAQVQDYTTTLVKQERFGDELEPEQKILIKWARPFRMYSKMLEGVNPGQEVLFVRGWNRDRLRAHKGSFPDITVSLDPRGRLAMAHSHHPMGEGSLPHLVDLVLANAREARRRGEGSLRLIGEESLFGRPCHKLEAATPSDFTTDTVGRGETLWEVAARHGAEMYAVLRANRDQGWARAGDASRGDRVRVPRYYAGRVLLWIDDATSLPLKAEIFDHDGVLYERYEHRDLAVNVGLGPLDFDPQNPAYDF
jgi:hypothetical protein